MNPQWQFLDPELRAIARRSVQQKNRRTRLHSLEQTAILVLSAAAIALVDLAPEAPVSIAGTHVNLRLWGNVIGLLAQPLWLHSTWMHRQWGMLALTVFYIGVWSTGIARYA